jgi:hypothetical protein
MRVRLSVWWECGGQYIAISTETPFSRDPNMGAKRAQMVFLNFL